MMNLFALGFLKFGISDAVDILLEGKENRVVAYTHGEVTDYDLEEALAMQKDISDYEYRIAQALSVKYEKSV